MTQLTSFLKLEVSKYKDIDHILLKLEEDGEVQNIFNLFKGIFDNELKFTLQELSKIQDSRKEPLNMKKQSENNLTLFKNNLGLITQMIMDKALKTTLAETKLKTTEANDTISANEETADPAIPNSASTIPPKTSERKPREKERQTPLSTVMRDHFLNLSSDTKGSALDKRLNFSQLSTSKVESPVSQILNNVPNSHRGKPNFNTSTTIKEKSFTQVSPRGSARAVQSIHSSRASFQAGDTSYQSNSSYVNSEFNHIGGSVKFSKSPRMREDNSQSPGPGTYKMKSTLKESPSQLMGKSPKVCWFDAHARTDSPGPVYNPSKHFLSKPL